MPSIPPMQRSKLIVFLLILATAALYWRGLTGPFLFDDGWNLAPIEQWRLGKATLREAIFGNGSLLLARPVAMASFVLTSSFGPGPFPYKLGNLILHLACGLLIWAVTLRLARQDSRLNPRAELVALIVTGFWLLHPLHVSTVLYSVQRMAQLASLFALAACWVYLVARRQLAQGHTRKAAANLFLAFPLLVGAGLLSKQNAAIAPLLCLVLELAYFRGQPGKRPVAVFFALSLGLPLLAVVAFLALHPNALSDGYAGWTFTLGQRLLTQPHALVEYLSMLLFPRGPLMGLYTDDFPISTGLLSPPSTLAYIAVLIVVSAAAAWLRKRAPIVFAGWFFFLASHLIESSVLPLEMYYEHRNYLPSVGILWMLVGGLASLPALNTNVLSPRQLGLAGAGLFAVMLAFATFGRVLIWEHKESIVAQGLAHHPHSVRAVFDNSTLALERKDFDAAMRGALQLARSDNAQHRLLAYLHLVAVECQKNSDADPAYLDAARSNAGDRLTVFESEHMRYLTTIHAEQGGCGRATASKIADAFAYLIERSAGQPESTPAKWAARFYTAQMLARADRWDEAERMGRIAWVQGRTLWTGSLLARLLVRQGRIGEAHELYRTLAASVAGHDLQGQAELDGLRSYFRDGGHPVP